jgi:hypothetical protein
MGLVMYLWGAPIAHGEFMLLRRCRRSAPACGFEHVGFWHKADLSVCPLFGRYVVESGL